jgi:signal transduction histidine kinase
VKGASALSERLLRFVHARGPEKPGTLDVRGAVHGAVELFDSGGGHRLPVVEDLGVTETRVAGFQADLQTALLNLFLNARDAMPGGGTLSVRTRDVALAPEGCAALAPYRVAPGRYLAIEVSDTGSGMPPEVLARCREPFFTTKGDGGTGLGLWMVHCVVTGHGGALSVASHPGAGTTVTIFLPDAAAAAGSAAG